MGGREDGLYDSELMGGREDGLCYTLFRCVKCGHPIGATPHSARSDQIAFVGV